MRLLTLFVNRSGDLISREEIAACLWGNEQNVDIVSGINAAVKQLRGVLDDNPASPKYIETVIGAGYRFIAKVVQLDLPNGTAIETTPPATPNPEIEQPLQDQRQSRRNGMPPQGRSGYE